MENSTGRRLAPRMLTASLIAMLLPAMGHASPFEIGDTDTGKGFKIQSYIAQVRSGDEVSWVRPALSLAWGLSDQAELSMGMGHAIIEPRGGQRMQGLQDVEFALKWQLFPASANEHGIALAMEPTLSMPWGDHDAGTGNDGAIVTVPLRASRQVGRSRITGEVSYSRDYAVHATSIGYGLLYERQVSARLALGAELLGHSPVSSNDSLRIHGHLGARWNPHDQWEIFGLVGRNLERNGGVAATVFKLGAEYAFD